MSMAKMMVKQKNQITEIAKSRILVALESSLSGLSILRSAASLAAILRAELQGLFIEDINLLRMAELPFTREIVSSSGVVRPLSSISMMRSLQLQAERARTTLFSISSQAQVQCSFYIRRGEIFSEVLAAVGEVDVIIMCQSAMQAGRLRGAIVVLLDDLATVQCTLASAQQLAIDNNCSLTVLLPTAGAEEIQHHAESVLAGYHGDVHFRYLSKISSTAISTAVRAEGGTMLVMNPEAKGLGKEDLRDLMKRVQQPMVLVR